MDGTVLKTMATSGDDPERETAYAEEGCHAENERPTFAAQFTSTPRGAQLARRVAVRRLEEWGHPPASDVSCTVALLVAELAANAVRHGRVPGRDFHLRLTSDVQARLIRIEISDASPARPPTGSPTPSPDDESGRGLLLVDILATGWGALPRSPIGKTVWAEVSANSTPAHWEGL